MYGIPWTVPVREHHPQRPLGDNGRAKIEAESIHGTSNARQPPRAEARLGHRNRASRGCRSQRNHTSTMASSVSPLALAPSFREVGT